MIDQFPRSAGILLHPTSFPGAWGIGEIGSEAIRWLELLRDSGQSLWQILPFGPTGYGGSPYQSTSSYAGNPHWISLDTLLEEGLLKESDLASVPSFDPEFVDFPVLERWKSGVLDKACAAFRRKCKRSARLTREYDAFLEQESGWLDDFALFDALRVKQEGKPWNEWAEPLRNRHPEALEAAREELAAEFENARIQQFLFDRQWKTVRAKALETGVKIIGDIPIFVAQDSADVWARPDLFLLNDDGTAPVVAGVPPDYFNADGQRWGNPLYRWDRHREENFAWWIERIRHSLSRVDLIRVDHFRGFAQYWEIPAHEPTARNGRWVDAPGYELFEAVRAALGDLALIAEDLGVITPDVEALRDHFHLPGMRVMQFAFGTDSLAEQYLPENYPENSVAYTGTHDNDTTLGWFRGTAGEGNTMTPEQIESQRRTTLAYTGTSGKALNWDFISLVSASKSRLAVYPLQDVLGLGATARMNLPGTVGSANWTWRFLWEDWRSTTAKKLKKIAKDTGRLGKLQGHPLA